MIDMTYIWLRSDSLRFRVYPQNPTLLVIFGTIDETCDWWSVSDSTSLPEVHPHTLFIIGKNQQNLPGYMADTVSSILDTALIPL